MKIDLHIHTSEISQCGHLSCEKVIDLYAAANYDAIVITNHFNRDTAEYFARQGVNDFNKIYHDVLRYAAEFGKARGLLVLGAYEVRFDENSNDYLVFGMNELLCRNYTDIFAMTPAEFSQFSRQHGLLFYQAHPFRNNMTVVKPELLFGIEVTNTHPRHDNRNDIAALWAKKYCLHQIAGSDCHRVEDVGTSAIFTNHPVKNMKDLIYVLANDLYQIG